MVYHLACHLEASALEGILPLICHDLQLTSGVGGIHGQPTPASGICSILAGYTVDRYYNVLQQLPSQSPQVWMIVCTL